MDFITFGIGLGFAAIIIDLFDRLYNPRELTTRL